MRHSDYFACNRHFYKEAGSCSGSVTIEGATSATAMVTVPSAAWKNIQEILEVIDSGTPPMLKVYPRVKTNLK